MKWVPAQAIPQHMLLRHGTHAASAALLQVLPQGWVNFTRQASEASQGWYGSLFWLNPFPKEQAIPETAFAAEGFTGQ